MNLTKRSLAILMSLAVVFTTLVFVSVDAKVNFPIHDTVVTLHDGSLDNAKGQAPNYLGDGKIAGFDVQDVGAVGGTTANSDADNLAELVQYAENNGKRVAIDLYAEFLSEKGSDTVGAGINFGDGWVTADAKNTNVENPNENVTVNFVNGKLYTLYLTSKNILVRDGYKAINEVRISLVYDTKDKITGSFFYSAPYVEGSERLSTVDVSAAVVTTTKPDSAFDGKIDIYDSPCTISGYDSTAYNNSKFLMGDMGKENEGRFAYIMNGNEENGNVQVQCKVLLSNFAQLAAQAKEQNKSICLDIYTNSFNYSTSSDPFCYLRYTFEHGRPLEGIGAKDIVFKTNIKKTLVFTTDITSDNAGYIIFQFENYEWSGGTLKNFEFIISAPYLEGSVPVDDSFVPTTTRRTTTSKPADEAFGNEISVYDNGVSYTSVNAWNGTNTASMASGDYKGKYVTIKSNGSPQQVQGLLGLSGLDNLKQVARETKMPIYIDVYANNFNNGTSAQGKCDFRCKLGEGTMTGAKDRVVAAGKKQTIAISLDNVGGKDNLEYAFQNYSYGSQVIRDATFIVSVPYTANDVDGADYITVGTTEATSGSGAQTSKPDYLEGDKLPITAPHSSASYTGGWGNPTNQVRVANNKVVYLNVAGVNDRAQINNTTSGFGDVVLEAAKSGKKVCFDFYGEFLQQNKTKENSSARIKMTFGNSVWFGSLSDQAVNGNNESNNANFIKLTPGEVVTQSYDPQAILAAFKESSSPSDTEPGVYEVEKITSGDTSKYTLYTQTDITPKDAQMHLYRNLAVGDSFEYTIGTQSAGTYNISVSSRDFSHRGTFDVYANDTKICSNLDLKSNGIEYVEHAIGRYKLEKEGKITLKFVCTKASAGEVSVVLDKFTVKDVNDSGDGNSSKDQMTDEEAAKRLNTVWLHILGGQQNTRTYGRYYMTVPYVEGNNKGSIPVTGPTTTTTKVMPTQPPRVTASGNKWDMSKINLDYVDARIPSYNWATDDSSIKRDISGKFVTITAKNGARKQQVGAQFNLNGGSATKPFSEYIAYAKQAEAKIAIDIYPSFTSSDKNNYAYVIAEFGGFNWPHENNRKAFRLTSGQKYTLYVDPDDLPAELSSMRIDFQNYEFGDGYMYDAEFNVTAPYIASNNLNPDLTSTTTTVTSKTTIRSSTMAYPSNNSAGTTKFYVSNTNVEPGGTVRVPICITQNEGIYNAKFSVRYNADALTFNDCIKGNIFSFVEYDVDNNGVINFLVFDNANVTENGVIAYLEFDATDIDDNYLISFAGSGYLPSNFFDYSAKNVPCSFKSGCVIVGEGGNSAVVEPDPGYIIPYPATNSGTTKFTISSVSESYKSGVASKDYALNVGISGNAGLGSVKFNIAYDADKLQFVSSDVSDNLPPVFNRLDYETKVDSSKAGVLAYEIAPKEGITARNTTLNGNIITIKFKLKKYAVGNYAVSFGGVDYVADNFKNAANQNVPCSFKSGSITVKSSALAKVALKNVTLSGKTASKLTWNKAAGAEKYEVYRSLGTSTKFVRVATVSTTSYTDKTLKAGSRYNYKVRAVSSGSAGAYSDVKSVTAMNYKTKTSVKSLKPSKAALKVTIKSKVAGAVGYQIQYSTNSKFKSAKAVTTKSLSATVKKLKSKKRYYVRVRSYNVVNGKNTYGAWSSAKNSVVK